VILYALAIAIGFVVYMVVTLAGLRRQVDALQRRVDQFAPPPQGSASWTAQSQAPPSSPQASPTGSPSTGPPPPVYAPRPGFAHPPSPPPPARPEPVQPELSRSETAGSEPVQPGLAWPPAWPEPVRPDPAAARGGLDVESMLGANWLARFGIAAIAVSTAFFLQYAFRNRWIGPVAQVSIGLAGAAIMTASAQLLHRNERYRAYAQVLFSGGVIVYFLSVYAAYGFYHPHLVGYWPAFIALSIGALAASALAIANGAEIVAGLCILGAFAVPWLMQSGAGAAPSHDDLYRLYAYLIGLDVWVAALLRFRPWHSLALVALAATWILFYATSPPQSAGWGTEAFATVFLLLFCYLGSRAASEESTTQASESEGAESGRDPDAQTAGASQWPGWSNGQIIGALLIAGACLAYFASGLQFVPGMGRLGLPDAVIVGLIVTIALTWTALGLKDVDASFRALFSVLAALSVLCAAWFVTLTAPHTPPGDAPAATAFSVVTSLLFLGLAILMTRRKETDAAAAFMAAATALSYLIAALRVTANETAFGFPAGLVFLPAAAWVLSLAIPLALRQRADSVAVPATLSVSAAACLALTAALAWADPATPRGLRIEALFALEFLLLSGTWYALQVLVAWKQVRADVLSHIVIAALFFALFGRVAGPPDGHAVAPLALLSVALAGYHACLAYAQRRENELRRMAFAGLAITFITIAIGIQLRASAITVGWCVEATVLVWAGLSAGDRSVRLWGCGLLALACAKALCVDLPAGAGAFRPLLNPRMLSGAAITASAYTCAWLLRNRQEGLSAEEKRLPIGWIFAANAFTLAFGSADLWDYVGQDGRQMALSIFWTIYALAAVSVGIWRRLRPLRLFAMGLLYFSIVKVFLYDLAGLEALYRIFSFFTLGVILLVVSLLYTRFESRLRADDSTPRAFDPTA
jgi:uncharacterized membrane protein